MEKFNYENNKRNKVSIEYPTDINHNSNLNKGNIPYYSFNTNCEDNCNDEFVLIKNKISDLKNNLESITSNLNTDFDDLEKKIQELINNSNTELLES